MRFLQLTSLITFFCFLSLKSQTNVSGAINSDVTWTLANSPYRITGSILITEGVTLTIEPGVVVNFTDDYKILIKGSLVADGNSSSSITFNGNSSEGNNQMILFKSTNLSNSSISYCIFNGPQKAIQLATESEHNQDSVKNSGILTVAYSDFNNAGLYTKGYSTSAELKFENSTFDDLTIKGYYPRSEPITFTNCVINNSIIDSDAYNLGISVIGSTIKNSNITMGCCSANFLFNESIVYNSNIRNGMGNPVNGVFKIIKSKFIESKIILPSAKLIAYKSVFTSPDSSENYISIGNTDSIYKSLFYGYSKLKDIDAIKISGKAGYDIGGNTKIKKNTFFNNRKAIIIEKKNNQEIEYNNINSSLYSIENLSSSDLTIENNYWGTTMESKIQDLIYDSNDNVDKGTVDYDPFLNELDIDAPISPPQNLSKVKSGDDIILSWSANLETDVAGYKLYYGNPTGYSYDNVIDLGNVNTYTFTDGDFSTEYAITAYDSAADGTDDQVEGNESWFSVSKTIDVAISSSSSEFSEPSGSVELTASLSNTHSSDVTVNLVYSGTATKDTDYSGVETITIPTGSSSKSITIAAIDDSEIEVDETVIIEVSSVSNATESGEQKITINLVSDDLPDLSSITVDKEEIFEHEKSIITAEISSAFGKDVDVIFNLSGTAINKADYNYNYSEKGKSKIYSGGNGIGSDKNQYNNPQGLSLDSNGNLYVADWDNNRVQKISNNQEISTIIDNVEAIDVHVNNSGEIYVLIKNSTVNKYDANGTFVETLHKGADGSYSMHITENGDIYTVNNKFPGSVYKSTKEAIDASLLFTDQRLHFANSIALDSIGNVYVSGQNMSIVKWTKASGEISYLNGKNLAGKFCISRIGEGSRAISISNRQTLLVAFDAGYQINNQGVFVASSPARVREYKLENGIANCGSLVFKQDLELNNYYLGINALIDDGNGNIYLAAGKDDDQSGSYFSDTNIPQKDRVLFVYGGPVISIPAGQTSATLEISAIEEFPENAEDDETVILTPKVINSNLNNVAASTITIKNNTLEFIKKDNPFIKLSKSSISWGDYDRDGDMDLAIMGQSNTVGAVTAIYKNNEGTFEDTSQELTKVYDGDLSWVDLNKDGWLDLVVAGYNNGAKTNIYLSTNEGQTFENSTLEWGIPNAYASKMSWGDLDNDGDIDLALVGIDDQENGFSNLYLRVDNQDKFIVQDLSYFSGGGFKHGDLEIADFDQDSDNDLIFTGERTNGELRSQIKLNTYITSEPKLDGRNVPYWDVEENIPFALKNASITTYFNQETKELSYIINGRDSNGELKTLIRSVGGLNRETNTPKIALENGDISVGDINNDGSNDFMYTGEDADGSPITKLFFTKNNTIVESDFEFVGLRESTVEFVDYDTDGDLDIFITGMSDDGAETILYEVNINSKVNSAPSDVKNLSVEDLGYGNVKFKWDESTDDFSNAIGYNLRIGTSSGGSELSNTLSNLETGSRLISSPPPILTNEFQTNLFPGNYYLSAQSIDPGVKASKFSQEVQFTLAYEWKQLNQGGIVDRNIAGLEKPVVKLADLDNDDDLDLIYGSEVKWRNDSGTIYDNNFLTSHKFDAEEKRLIRFDRERKTENSLSNLRIHDVTDIQVGNINDDNYPDVIINRFAADGVVYGESPNLNDLFLHFGKAPVDGGSSNLNEETLIYDQIRLGDGLFEGKIKIVDLNNDGKSEIVQIGLTSNNSTSGKPKIIIYTYIKDSNSFEQTDISDQIAALTNASFDIGDYDNDQDVDVVISGFDASNGLQTFIYDNITESGSNDYKLQVTDNVLGASRDGSVNFFDMENDGDLDVIITGTSFNGDVFEIYENKVRDTIKEWPKVETNIPGIRLSKVEFGDFNGDGYSDLLYSGVQSGSGKISELREFDNNAKNYVKSSFDIGNIIDADVEFGDIDGDGDLDFVLSGTKKDNDKFHVINTYLNVRSESAELLNNVNNNSTGIIIKQSTAQGARNTSKFVKNNPPDAPSIESVSKITDQDVLDGKILVELSWGQAKDDFTGPEGLTYSVRVGTSPGDSDVMSANASAETGFRKTPSKGNAEHNLKWKLALSPGKYYYSVQAIDASFIGSVFSNEGEFTVTEDDVSSNIDSDGDGVINSNDNCPNTPEGVKVDVNGCEVFTMPVSNFKVEVAKTTCIGNSDGMINLSVEDATVDYTVTITGKDNVTITGDSKTASVSGLAKGTYTVCFKVDGQSNYEQCFDVVVGEPEKLNAFVSVDEDDKKLSITMSGSNVYNVEINGRISTVSSNSFTTELNTGLSIIKVYTDLECQGSIEQEVFISEDIHYYPNPTDNDVKVHVGGEDQQVKVSVFTSAGALVYTQEQTIEDITRKTQIDLSKQQTGTYVVVMESKTVRKTFKIIRE